MYGLKANVAFVDTVNVSYKTHTIPDSKVHGANMGPIWGRQDPDGPHFGPVDLAIWDVTQSTE